MPLGLSVDLALGGVPNTPRPRPSTLEDIDKELVTDAWGLIDFEHGVFGHRATEGDEQLKWAIMEVADWNDTLGMSEAEQLELIEIATRLDQRSIPLDYAFTALNVESTFNTDTDGGSFQGPFQYSDEQIDLSLERPGDINNIADQCEAFANDYFHWGEVIEARYGRPIKEFEYYLLHNQGERGALVILDNAHFYPGVTLEELFDKPSNEVDESNFLYRDQGRSREYMSGQTWSAGIDDELTYPEPAQGTVQQWLDALEAYWESNRDGADASVWPDRGAIRPITDYLHEIEVEASGVTYYTFDQVFETFTQSSIKYTEGAGLEIWSIIANNSDTLFAYLKGAFKDKFLSDEVTLVMEYQWHDPGFGFQDQTARDPNGMQLLQVTTPLANAWYLATTSSWIGSNEGDRDLFFAEFLDLFYETQTPFAANDVDRIAASISYSTDFYDMAFDATRFNGISPGLGGETRQNLPASSGATKVRFSPWRYPTGAGYPAEYANRKKLTIKRILIFDFQVDANDDGSFLKLISNPAYVLVPDQA